MGVKKKIRQLTKEGVFIQTFESAKEASDELKINQTLISKVCNNIDDLAGGYKWEFVEVVLQVRRKEKGKRTYKNGCFYHPDKPNIIVALSPYGIMNSRYSTSNNHEAIVNLNKLKR